MVLNVDNDETTQSNKNEVAEHLNNNFKSVYITENRENIPKIPNVCYDLPTLDSMVINREDLKKQLNKWDIKKGHDPDDTPARIIKEVKEVIMAPLFKLFYASLKDWYFP